MQLMTLNSLLMFDVVFIFFLFLVGVSCAVYYMPAGRHPGTDAVSYVTALPSKADRGAPVDDV
jgi:hypothetical protein